MSLKKIITLSANHEQYFENLRELTEIEVQDAIILFSAICPESEHTVVVEYLKGVMHLGMNYYDINFHREAFGNFYRVIEYIVTNRILKKRKLKNELFEIQKVYRDLGADETLISEFNEVYRKRSSQIMHAQIQPESIIFDDVVIAKTFCDFLLNTHYRAIAENWRRGKVEIDV